MTFCSSRKLHYVMMWFLTCSVIDFLLKIWMDENKIPIFCSVQSQENDNYDFELLLGSRELLRISHDDYYFPASYLLEYQ